MDTAKLRPVDRLNIVGMSLISMVALIYHQKVEHCLFIVISNIIMTFGIIALVNLDARRRRGLVRFLANWYSIPLIFLTFKELYFMVHQINPHDLDFFLIRIDKVIFGGDPTAILDRIATPGLTEFLQICYSSFYLLWLILGIDLLLHHNEEGFLFFMFVLMFGFYLSYAGYLLVPAIGPRFTLYNFADLDKQLPGLYLTDALRGIINSGESITNVAKAAALAQRDCFPSGHTEMTLITIATAIRYRCKSAMVIIPLGVGLIFATVYMRYHYGIDVIAGVLAGVFVMASGRWLQSKLTHRTSDNRPANDSDERISADRERLALRK